MHIKWEEEDGDIQMALLMEVSYCQDLSAFLFQFWSQLYHNFRFCEILSDYFQFPFHGAHSNLCNQVEAIPIGSCLRQR